MLIQHRRHTIESGNQLTESENSKFHTGILSQLLTLVQQLSDFGLAINAIPGFLWGGKLKPRHTGLLGIISTFINLCKMLRIVP